MRKLKIGIIDLVTQGPVNSMWARVMYPNYAAIMPQVLGAWCEQAGHEVTFVCYTGRENLLKELPDDADVIFIGAFTQASMLAYAVSNIFRSRGAITVLGGPHARCFPQDAVKYFDYVLGFTDKDLITDLLRDPVPNRPLGVRLATDKQPAELPGVEERWKYIETTIRKAPFLKIVPVLGSLGCPYTCSFCIDADIPYQPLDLEVIKTDLRFLKTKFKNPLIVWHDPNFGIRFDDFLGAMEEAVPPGSIRSIAESSLAILSEDRLKRMKKNGFVAMLPGVESWYSLGGKSKTAKRIGLEKVTEVSEHINTIMEYIPYLQANFVFGLDCDEGDEPFELQKKFIDLSPGSFPGYSLLTAFGQAAPLNLGYQREGRVRPFPFFFLNNNGAMNVKPMNYDWKTFYDHVIDVTQYSFSWPRIWKRYKANKHPLGRRMNFLRAVSQEGFGRIKYFKEIRRRMDTDPQFMPFFDGKTTKVPDFYIARIKKSMGDLWHWLPDGALYHDPVAYMKEEEVKSGIKTKVS